MKTFVLILLCLCMAAVSSQNCESSPCKNGGSCLSDGNNSYKCTCPSKYTGTNCETELRCGSNQEYNRYASKCQPTCANRKPKCTERGGGCECILGYILSDSKCVRLSECGCVYNNIYLAPNTVYYTPDCVHKVICEAGGNFNAKILDPCQTYSVHKFINGSCKCVCMKGYIRSDGKCIPDRCTCTASGDPHYLTYDGQMIHFMGVCKYTLSQNTAGTNFSVEVKNEYRYGATHVSYTRLVDIKIGNVTIRILPGLQIKVNGITIIPPINNDPSFSISLSGSWATVTTPWGLLVRFDGDSRVIVSVPVSYRNNLTGICGDCNGIKDDLRTKNGTDVSRERHKYSLVGDSYLVIDDSDKPTNSCSTNDTYFDCKREDTIRCEFMFKSIFDNCVIALGRALIIQYFEACKIDVCAYLTTPSLIKVFCKSIESLAQICEYFGVNIDWRKAANCTKTCDDNQEYKYMAKTCQPSCADRNPVCTDSEEACVCKDGYILSGKKCVNISQCGCVYYGVYYEPNTELYFTNCSKKMICNPGGNWSEQKLQPCPLNADYKFIEKKCVCICRKGYVKVNGQCVKECGSNEVYKFNVTKCQPTCVNRKPDCTEREGACVCKDGYILHRKSCVPISQCGCVDNGVYLEPNSVFYLTDCSKKIICPPGGKWFIKSLNPCQKNAEYKYVNGKCECFCIKGYIMRSGLCIPECGSNEVYKFNVTKCQPTCANRKPDCTEREGACVCKDGYILNRKSCVPISLCGCVYKGEYFEPNSVFYLTDCSKKRICQPGGKWSDKSLNPCQKNAEYKYVNGKCECFCIKGYIMRSGLCIPECGSNEVYKFNVTKCQPTCANRKPDCTEREGACVCKDGYILNRKSCIPISLCGCVYKGEYFEPNSVFYLTDCSKKRICQPGGKWSDKSLNPCQKNAEYKYVNGKCECFCIKGYIMRSGLCIPECGSNEVYKFNVTKCQPTCANRKPDCTEREGACVCKDGYILNGKSCVPISLCGCVYKGEYFEPNSVIYLTDCSKKRICQPGGKWSDKSLNPCQKNAEYKYVNGKCECFCIKGYIMRSGLCIPDSCKCFAFGDPHYRTYDKQFIHFMGICKYIMSESTSGEYFSVQVTNEHRAGVTDVSYTRMVEVKFANVVISILKGKTILVNGVVRSSPIFTTTYCVIFSGNWVTVYTYWGLKVQFDGDHRVTIRVPSRLRKRMIGICGDCNGKKDDLRTKDGENVKGKPKADSLVGDSYSIAGQCDNATHSPIYNCTKEQVKRCQFLYNAIFKRCHIALGMEQVRQLVRSCEIDVCAYLKNPFLHEAYCKAIEGFMQICECSGIVVDWRRVVKCTYRCGENQSYQYNASTCQPHCGITKKKTWKGNEEACVCDKGYILSGNKCVPVSQCGCTHNGIYLQVKQQYVTIDCRKRIICVAPGKIQIQYLKPCIKNAVCKSVDRKRKCVCKKGYIMKHGICFPADCVIRGDIMIAFDVSKGITKTNFSELFSFINYLITRIFTSDGKSRIGILAFSQTVFYKIKLGTYINKWRIFFALNLLRNTDIYRKGYVRTNLDVALAYLASTFINCAYSYSYCVPKYAFIISYSKSSNLVKTRQNAIRLKSLGVKVFSIGIGRNIDINEMRFIASHPQTFFYVFSFGRLFFSLNWIHIRLCHMVVLYKPCFYCPYGCHCYPVCNFCNYPKCCRSRKDCKPNQICWKGQCKTKLRKY